MLLIISHWSNCDREPTPASAEQSSDSKTEGWRPGELMQVHFELGWRLDTCLQMSRLGYLIGSGGFSGRRGE